MKKSLLTWETDWPKASERFWSKVNKTDTCWLWQGTVTFKKCGVYGQFSMKKRKLAAHRVSYRAAHGPIPDGLQVDHKCRVKLCVNPAHLRLATNKQNAENIGLSKKSTSGVRNVVWVPTLSKWKVVISHNRKRLYFGMFTDIKEAEAVAVAKRLELHPTTWMTGQLENFHSTMKNRLLVHESD